MRCCGKLTISSSVAIPSMPHRVKATRVTLRDVTDSVNIHVLVERPFASLCEADWRTMGSTYKGIICGERGAPEEHQSRAPISAQDTSDARTAKPIDSTRTKGRVARKRLVHCSASDFIRQRAVESGSRT